MVIIYYINKNRYYDFSINNNKCVTQCKSESLKMTYLNYDSKFIFLNMYSSYKLCQKKCDNNVNYISQIKNNVTYDYY